MSKSTGSVNSRLLMRLLSGNIERIQESGARRQNGSYSTSVGSKSPQHLHAVGLAKGEIYSDS
ncbi:hypothetical protein G7B40_021235 [Aetokthonos hydrillicola Thurmond2011]|uniref:Uncharacterized protein n=1 Tax=Aetokthonos hydrillicola Thurmond2011 TaxID=2712845 RepID=A0AAP5I923_9CYAN|nr:hypothetical protein [Aetokthonos hydrillicola Thurmond2011]